MLLIKNATIESQNIQSYYKYYTNDSAFFDIETTGLNWRNSHVYLIGAAYFDNDTCHIRQWFLKKPFEEKELLEDFSAFLSRFRRVIHFNGNSFDIPYLQHKYTFYQLQEPFSSKESFDFYRVMKPWKNFLGLGSVQQKDVERYAGLDRKDIYSGGELIPLYQRYLSTGDSELLDLLCLHNYEDVTGMIGILPMLAYPDLVNHNHNAIQSDWSENDLVLSYKLAMPVPKKIHLSDLQYSLTIDHNQLIIHVFAVHTSMKHYFNDYKNYYYLPMEDTVIHKSVAAYVDSGYKEKAKASNCYQRTEGIFLPQPSRCFDPVFYADSKGEDSFFLYRQENLKDIMESSQYVNSIIKHFM